jgi:hypothetical protein
MIISGDGSITGLVAGGLPDATVTQPELATGVAGTGPAFSAYASVSQTVTSTTETKIQLNVEEFDTASCFDNTTNYRFTPNVAGYYQINGILRGAATTALNLIFLSLYKNGAAYIRGSEYPYAVAGGPAAQVSISALVYLNGTTDYLELYGRIDGTGTCTFEFAGTPFTSRMNGALVRSAT